MSFLTKPDIEKVDPRTPEQLALERYASGALLSRMNTGQPGQVPFYRQPGVFSQLYEGDMAKSYLPGAPTTPGSIFDKFDQAMVGQDPRLKYNDSDYGNDIIKYLFDVLKQDGRLPAGTDNNSIGNTFGDSGDSTTGTNTGGNNPPPPTTPPTKTPTKTETESAGTSVAVGLSEEAARAASPYNGLVPSDPEYWTREVDGTWRGLGGEFHTGKEAAPGPGEGLIPANPWSYSGWRSGYYTWDGGRFVAANDTAGGWAAPKKESTTEVTEPSRERERTVPKGDNTSAANLPPINNGMSSVPLRIKPNVIPTSGIPNIGSMGPIDPIEQIIKTGLLPDLEPMPSPVSGSRSMNSYQPPNSGISMKPNTSMFEKFVPRRGMR